MLFRPRKNRSDVPKNSADIFTMFQPGNKRVTFLWPTLWAKSGPQVAVERVAIFFMLTPSCHPRIAVWLIHHPYRFSILTDSFPKRLTIYLQLLHHIYGRLLGASNFIFGRNLRQIPRHALIRAGISYRFYECCVHWASGSIHFQLSFHCSSPYLSPPSFRCMQRIHRSVQYESGYSIIHFQHPFHKPQC